MDIAQKLIAVTEDRLRSEIMSFLADFMTPAYGSLPKREIELRVLDLMRNLGVIDKGSTIYSLMSDLKVTRAKASQMMFDLEIRHHGGNIEKLDELIKHALIETKFTKDGDYFVMEIENPLTLAHMRQRIRETGHISDTSFNSALVRAPVDAITDLMMSIVPIDQHDDIKAALIEAGAPDGSVKAVIKGALKNLGRKVVGAAADEVVDAVFNNSAEYLQPLLNAGVGQIRERWVSVFAGHKDQ
jgi:hypothetical protein